MDEYLQTNRQTWDAWTEINAASEFYDLDSFKRGRCSLQPVEIEELGEVAGKSLLHLQCHFGMDTLSWARRGAKVTGVDFSPKAIDLARSLSAELDIPAEFICADVYDLPADLAGKFDAVFTSEGIHAWLPDLRIWAQNIARCLRPGGVFYIYEFHPILGIFDYDRDEPVIASRYFHINEPEICECEGSYAGRDTQTRLTHEWSHSMADIVNAVIGAGLRIEFLHEFDHCSYPGHPWLTKCDDGLWRYLKVPQSIPLMFSVRAAKPE